MGWDNGQTFNRNTLTGSCDECFVIMIFSGCSFGSLFFTVDTYRNNNYNNFKFCIQLGW